MYKYMIYKTADETTYKRQCAALEKNIPGLKAVEELHDVDGSDIMIYALNGNKVRVLNDCYLNAVHVESETPLEVYFSNEDKKAI